MTTIPTVSPTELIRSSWGNAVASEVNVECLKKPGGTMTGALYLPAAMPTNPVQATHKNYVDAQTVAKVDKAGDTMTGNLDVGGFTNTTPGNLIRTDGIRQTSVNTGSPTSTPNAMYMRGGTCAGTGGRFALFSRAATTAFTNPVIIGSIVVAAGGSSVDYVTTSDYRLKTELGPIDDPIGRIDALRPIRFAWRDTGAERDGFFAHELADVIPWAVHGAKDDVVSADDVTAAAAAGQQLTLGEPQYQQVTETAIVPLLVAAVQTLAARVAELEAR